MLLLWKVIFYLLWAKLIERLGLIKLKLGKAAGLNGVQPEHIVYAHPAVVMHLRKLFNLVIQNGHVPDLMRMLSYL